MRHLIAAGTRTGEFVPCDPALAARAILGALNWSVRWFHPEGALTAAEIAEGFAGYLIRGLLAKPDSLSRRSTTGKIGRPIRNPLPQKANLRAASRRFSER